MGWDEAEMGSADYEGVCVHRRGGSDRCGCEGDLMNKKFDQEKWNDYNVIVAVLLSILSLIAALILLISKAVPVFLGGG